MLPISNIYAKPFRILHLGNFQGYAELLFKIALDIPDIIERCTKVDWENNVNIHNEIAQEIDDLFWSYEKKGLKLHYEQVEKIIENVKTVAVKRF